ncbi:FUSC family protein [Rhodovibrio salinarum]|uniref:FUSC family protein n=1 Tax=Rhodovibrio salinarum TaxID=1087 RepID=A0A934QJT3_9PROT|nr:FUSC family protein [Rhodovibrio salinarum]MBK1697982.1 FUSC family protein [Rhodovibrio salinarum]
MSSAKPLAVEDVVFSVKTFSASMLAYWIALRFGLEQPFWAAGTVYITANPLAGANTSKAVYRLIGTVLGAAMTVVLVPNLFFSPVLLSLGIAGWCGTCLFIAMLDRTPRAYLFQLSGYTAALTGFALVNTPEVSFDYAVARVEEIAIGILCSAVIARSVFPRAAGPVLARRVEGWLDNAGSLTHDVLLGNGKTDAALRQRHDLAADAVDLRSFTTHVGYEGIKGQALTNHMNALQQRMVALLPLLSEIADIVSELDRSAEGRGREGILLERIATWISSSDEDVIAQADALLAEISQERTPREDRPRWRDLLVVRLAKRLRDLVEVWRDCRLLRMDMAQGSTHALSQALSVGDRRPANLHSDYGMALLSACAVVVAILLSCSLWIATDWSYGSYAVQIASILCCVLATLDDARPALQKVMLYVAAAACITFVYEFAILPWIHGFVPLVLALGLFLIPVGILLAIPARWLMGFQLSVNLIYMLQLDERLRMDFVAFANVSLATLIGVAIATIVLATVRAIGAETSASRLLKSGWGMVIETARTPRRIDRETVLHRMTDQLGLLVPKLAAVAPDSSLVGNDILRDLRVALDTLKIQRNKNGLSAPQRQTVEDLLERLAAHYRARRAGKPAETASLLMTLDACLRTLPFETPLAAPPRRVRDALVGLRNALFPASDPPELIATSVEGGA